MNPLRNLYRQLFRASVNTGENKIRTRSHAASPSPIVSKKRRNRDKPKTIWEKTEPFREVIALGCQVGTTLLLIGTVIVYKWQLDQMKISTDAATSAAKASQEGVLQSGTFGMLDERAWIDTKTPTIHVAEGSILSGTIQFVNTGRTPAKNVKIAVSCDVITKTDPSTVSDNNANNIIFHDEDITKIMLTGIFLPSGENPQGKLIFGSPAITGTLSEPLFTQITHGKQFILIHQTTTYLDVFEDDKAKPHEFRVAWDYDPLTGECVYRASDYSRE